ncbi:MAG: diaminopimelate epimerase [Clostridiaceae bacterium]|jgi:diaminopimelate epimerase|nr:diaminopimelate epimerase [Clostridiaceae bacterium]
MDTKTVKITKMQGCGNDFVIIDYDEFEKTKLSMPEFAKQVCDRNFGVGADGLIIPDLHPNNETDIAWFFYNSDGSTAQMCGNGMRCFSKYVFDKKIITKKSFSVKTLAGIIKPEILDDGNIKVNMGVPILDHNKIPFRGDKTIKALGEEFEITPVSMGNPHCVIFVKDKPLDFAKKYGPTIEKHKFFPEKTNTEFVKVLSKNEVEMRVYERGCGITLACGTGACASVVAGVLNNLTENKVKVNLLGGSVFVEWQGSQENPNKDIFLIGPANYSFTADYML